MVFSQWLYISPNSDHFCDIFKLDNTSFDVPVYFETIGGFVMMIARAKYKNKSKKF